MTTPAPTWKRAWLQIFAPLGGVVLIDQWSKAYVLKTPGFSIILNTGMIAGAYSQAPQFMKTMIIFSLFFIMASVFFLLQFLVFKTEKNLSILLSLLLGAFGSNLVDKFRFGGAIDFIPIKISADSAMVLNVADFVQQIVIAFLVGYLIKNHERIWPLLNVRKTWVIDRSFQITSALFTTIFALVSGIGVAILSYLFYGPKSSGSEVMAYWITVGLFLVCFFILVFLFSLVYFNRSAGPVFAAVKFIDKLERGEFGQMKLRKTDYFRSLESSLNRLAEKLSRR